MNLTEQELTPAMTADHANRLITIGYLNQFCDMFERLFIYPSSEFTHEEMMNYIDAALFLKHNTRKDSDVIDEVKRRMNGLPY